MYVGVESYGYNELMSHLSVGMSETLKAKLSCINSSTFLLYFGHSDIEKIATEYRYICILYICISVYIHINDSDTVSGICGINYTLHLLLYLW